MNYGSVALRQLYRRLKCRDLVVVVMAPVVRRAVLPNGKIVEVTK